MYFPAFTIVYPSSYTYIYLCSPFFSLSRLCFNSGLDHTSDFEVVGYSFTNFLSIDIYIYSRTVISYTVCGWREATPPWRVRDQKNRRKVVDSIPKLSILLFRFTPTDTKHLGKGFVVLFSNMAWMTQNCNYYMFFFVCLFVFLLQK